MRQRRSCSSEVGGGGGIASARGGKGESAKMSNQSHATSRTIASVLYERRGEMRCRWRWCWAAVAKRSGFQRQGRKRSGQAGAVGRKVSKLKGCGEWYYRGVGY